MAFVHGKNTVFKVDNSGGTLTDISTYVTDVSLSRSVDTAETSTFGSTDKSYVVGLRDSSFSITGKYDAAVDSHLNGILGQTASVSFEYGPEGSTAGSTKYTGEAYCTSFERSSAVGDATSFTANFQVTGSVTRGTYA